MGQIATIYSNIILEFLLELYIFCVFFFIRLEKRNYFIQKVIGGFAAVLVISVPIAYLYQLIGAGVWGRVLIYALLFVIVIMHAKFCYRDSTWVILFCTSMAYAAQNLMYKLFLTFWCYIEQNNLLALFGHNYALSYRIIYYLFMAHFLTVCKSN